MGRGGIDVEEGAVGIEDAGLDAVESGVCHGRAPFIVLRSYRWRIGPGAAAGDLDRRRVEVIIRIRADGDPALAVALLHARLDGQDLAPACRRQHVVHGGETGQPQDCEAGD